MRLTAIYFLNVLFSKLIWTSVLEAYLQIFSVRQNVLGNWRLTSFSCLSLRWLRGAVQRSQDPPLHPTLRRAVQPLARLHPRAGLRPSLRPRVLPRPSRARVLPPRLWRLPTTRGQETGLWQPALRPLPSAGASLQPDGVSIPIQYLHNISEFLR